MTVTNYRRAGLKATMMDVTTFLDLQKLKHRPLTAEESLALDEIRQGFRSTDGMTVLEAIVKINESGVHCARRFKAPVNASARTSSTHERQPGQAPVSPSRSSARNRGFSGR